jgi:nucleoside-diphosphate-sugar epimerase
VRVLVIGGTRFIGRFTVERLAADGHDVTVFHRGETEPREWEKIHHLHGDRANLALFAGDIAGFAPEVVLDMVPLREVDAQNVIDVVGSTPQRLVAVSSQDVYRAYSVVRGKDDDEPQSVPIPEDGELRRERFPYRDDVAEDHPLHHYDKIPVEEHYRSAGIPATILRLPAVYGPHDAQHRTAAYLQRMLDGREVILVSDRLAGWQWTRSYVDDAAAAIALAVTDDRAAGHTFNVGEPDAMSELEWIRAIAAAAGWSGEIRVVPDARLPASLRSALNPTQHLVVDSSRIRATLGYAERIGREEGLARTVAWESAQPHDPIDYAAEDGAITASDL